MSMIEDLKSWLWVIPFWIIAYSVVVTASVAVSVIVSPSLYWWVFFIGVLTITIPIVYRNLVGGGCSIRFQICSAVKGALLGMLFFVVSFIVDPYIWSLLAPSLGWSAIGLGGVSIAFYQSWFYAGAVGGIAAQMITIRRLDQAQSITIAGYEER